MRRTAYVTATTVLSFVLLTSAGWAKPPCERIEGEWDITFTDHWEGLAWGFIGDEPFVADLDFETLAGRETDEGSFIGIEAGTFDFGDGDTFTEVDKFTFGPSDEDPTVFTYNSVGSIVEGTGKFLDSSGHLNFHGTSPLPIITAEGTVHGRICDMAGD